MSNDFAPGPDARGHGLLWCEASGSMGGVRGPSHVQGGWVPGKGDKHQLTNAPTW